MPPKAQTYKGMKDYLPGEMRLRQYIISTLTAVATRYGFEPMQTPIVEYEDTIAGKLGDDEKLIYRLQYGDDRLALRYDQTVSLARVIAQYPNEITLPFRRWAVGPSYRGERQQRGRFREFYQFDLDIVGAGGPLADAEVIAVISDALQALGFSGFRVLLNNREILSALARVVGVDDAAAAGVYRAIDKFDKIGAQGVREQLLQAGVTTEAAEEIVRFTQLDGPTADVLDAVAAQLCSDTRGTAAVQELHAVVRYLQELGVDPVTYAVAPRLARGLSYYTGTVFEAVIEQPPIGSLLGGGRYDNLIGAFAGRSVPTVGTAFGIERLQIVMTELGLGPQSEGAVAAYVTIFNAELAGEALRLAGELRRAGIATITALGPDKLGKQLKEAAAKSIPFALILGPDKLGKQLKEAAVKSVPFALILGPDEVAKGEVVVRDLRSGEQRNVGRGAVVEAVRGA